MSDRLHSLGEIVETIMGQAPPGSACNKEGRGTVFVKAGEFADPLPLVREWTTKPIKRAWSTDVLVCVVGATAGKVSRSIDCAIGRSVAAIRPIEKHVDSGYLFHFLSTKTLFLREKSQGLAQGVITRDMIESRTYICRALPNNGGLRRSSIRPTPCAASAGKLFIIWRVSRTLCLPTCSDTRSKINLASKRRHLGN